MKINIFLASLIGIVCGMDFTSCAPDYETEFNVEKLEVPYKNQAAINFGIEGGERAVAVVTNVPIENWSATSSADWCMVEKQKDKVAVSAGINDSYITRVARVTIAYGYQSYDIDVTQVGKESILLVEGKQDGAVKEIKALEEMFTVKVTTDLELNSISIPDTVPWLQAVSVQPSENETEKIVTFKAENNISSTPRYGKIMLQSSQNYDHIATFVVAQSAKYAFRNIPLTVNMLSTNAQETNEGDIKYLVDNDAGTFFHSAWSYTVNEAHYFQIRLADPITGCKFWYQNRNSGGGGKTTKVTITVSSDNQTWTKLAEITSGLPTGGGSQYQSGEYFSPIVFKYFRFTVNNTNENSVHFSMAEFKLDEIYDLD